MRAAVFERVGEPLSIEEVPVPAPKPGQALLRIRRAGICSSDIEMTSGGDSVFPSGTILGHEFAGEVVELGGGVSSLAIGDHVAVIPSLMMEGNGAFAEYAPVIAADCYQLPKSLSWEAGALVEPVSVGRKATRLAGVVEGSAVLIIGAGPMGLGIAYWSRRLGAASVTVVASSNRRQAHAEAMGATEFLVAEQLSDRYIVADLLDYFRPHPAEGPDCIFECVGKPGVLAQAINLASYGGTVTMLGLIGGEDTFRPTQAFAKGLRFQYALGYEPEDFRATIATLAEDDRQPRTMISTTVSLDALPAIFEEMRAPSDYLKVHVDPVIA